MARFTHTPERLKSIATKLDAIVQDAETPTELFTHFMNVVKNQYDYFSNFYPHDLIKIVINLWSIKTTGDTKYADEIFENLFFAGFIRPDGRKAEKECDQCDGNGRISCDYCDGDGRLECDECDGDGNVPCGKCGGDGEDEEEDGTKVECDQCSGEGTEECDTCHGRGDVSCNNCYGDGDEECQECYGSGNVETDEDVFFDVHAVCWNKEIFERCELTKDTKKPTFDYETFQKLEKTWIMVISSDEEYHNFFHSLNEDYYYCYEIDDSPSLFIEDRKFIKAFDVSDNDFYI